MRVGIDLRPLQEESRFRGIGRVVRGLWPGLRRQRPDWEWTVLLWSGRPVPRSVGPDVTRLMARPMGEHPLLSPILANRCALALLEASNLDHYIATDPEKGCPASLPTTAIFYDAIPVRFSNAYFPRREGWSLRAIRQRAWHRIREWTYRSALDTLSRARRVVAIGHSPARDARRFFGVPSSRLSVVRPPVSLTHLRGGEAVETPFVLSVGGVDARKNLSTACRVFERVADRHEDLEFWICGRDVRRADRPEVRELEGWLARTGLGQRVRRLGYVSDAHLGTLYRSARALLFPSRYEGFGLPVAEALALGCPVVCARVGALSEFADPRVEDPDDVDGLVADLNEILADPEAARDRARRLGRPLIDEDEDRYAREVLDVMGLV